MFAEDVSRQKILIVEDEVDMVDILKDVLESIGFQTAYAYDGEAAFEILKSQKINLVLSDINLPKITGVQLLAKARRQNIQAPFVFLTGVCDPEIIIDAVRLGATDFLLKPFEISNLEKVIKRVGSIASRMDYIDDLLRSFGQDVAPQMFAEINNLRRQISLLRTME